MAKFYSEIESMRGNSVHRLGYHDATARVCSWHGGIETTLYEDERSGEIRVKITARPWQGSGKWNLLYDGPLADCFEASPVKPLYTKQADDLAAAAQRLLDAFGGNIPDWIMPELADLQAMLDSYREAVRA